VKIRVLLLGAAASLAMAGAANAGGWYVAAEAGLNGIGEEDVSGTFLGSPTTGTFEADLGWAVMASVGNAFSPGWRLEAELGFRHNDASSDLAQVTDISLMANVLYDFELSKDFDLTLGAGLGIAHTKLIIDGFSSDTDVNVAYQALVGLSYAVGPSTDLTLAYRYMDVVDPTIQIGQAVAIEFDSISNRTLSVGLRLHFSPDE
jgi:opacity protein-like surface antigen